MKLSPLALCLMGGLAFATPTLAFDPAAMTDTERSAFRDEIRAYLLDNPEVLMEAIGVLEQRQQQEQVNNDLAILDTNHDAIFNDPASWVGGNLDGDITVVEFTDYRCGYCRKAHDEVAELIKSDGNIRFVIKEFPILGDASITSSRFAIAVLQLADGATYKKVHDALITLRGEPTTETLTRLATDMGLDAPTVLAKMNSDEVSAVIAANHALAGRLDISGTPTFVINRTMVRGYVPLDGMRQIVQGQRRR
jgi:protein-disulfide isomerase